MWKTKRVYPDLNVRKHVPKGAQTATVSLHRYLNRTVPQPLALRQEQHCSQAWLTATFYTAFVLCAGNACLYGTGSCVGTPGLRSAAVVQCGLHSSSTRQTDHHLSETTFRRRLSNPSIQKHNMCGGGVGKSERNLYASRRTQRPAP